MVEEGDGRRLLRRLLPRVVKAAVGAAFYLLLLHFLPLGAVPPMLGWLKAFAEGFVIILLFFAVAEGLVSGTILEYVLGFARGLILIAFTWNTLNGGLLAFSFPTGDQTLSLTFDLSVHLAMFLLAILVGLAKSVLEVLDFLSKRVELGIQGIERGK